MSVRLKLESLHEAHKFYSFWRTSHAKTNLFYSIVCKGTCYVFRITCRNFRRSSDGGLNTINHPSKPLRRGRSTFLVVDFGPLRFALRWRGVSLSQWAAADRGSIISTAVRVEQDDVDTLLCRVALIRVAQPSRRSRCKSKSITANFQTLQQHCNQ